MRYIFSLFCVPVGYSGEFIWVVSPLPRLAASSKSLAACMVSGSELNNAGKEAVEWTATLPKKVQLALLVLEGWRQQQQHPSEDYYWKPFLDSWPDAVPGLPEHLSLEELEREAQCQQLVEATKKHLSWVLSNYAAVQKLAPPTDDNNLFGMVDVDLPTFQKSLQLVGSRSIRVSASSSILVPLLDLANHDANPSRVISMTMMNSRRSNWLPTELWRRATASQYPTEIMTIN